MNKQSSPWRQRINASRAEGLAAREYFVVLSEPAGDKEAVRVNLPAHLEYQRELEGKGMLLAAGPLSDEAGVEWTGKGLIIIRAASLDEARTIADADPMHQDGIRKYTLLPWLLNEGNLTISISLASQKVELQ